MSAHFDHCAPEAPCDRCSLSRVCGTQKLLCEAYFEYCEGGNWKTAMRAPTHELFLKMYRLHTAEEYERLEKQLAARRERHRATCRANGVRDGRKSEFVSV